jgi:hypothetical protein
MFEASWQAMGDHKHERCKQGHPLTEDNLRFNGAGFRCCRICSNLRQNQRRRERRAELRAERAAHETSGLLRAKD